MSRVCVVLLFFFCNVRCASEKDSHKQEHERARVRLVSLHFVCIAQYVIGMRAVVVVVVCCERVSQLTFFMSLLFWCVFPEFMSPVFSKETHTRQWYAGLSTAEGQCGMMGK